MDISINTALYGEKKVIKSYRINSYSYSIPAFEFIQGYRRLHEPVYVIMDRILSEYEDRKTQNTELEIFNQDLKVSLEVNQIKRQKLKSYKVRNKVLL